MKATDDLRAASILVEEEFDDYHTSVFHAQQAAEKLMKAFLVRHQVEFPKTHDIKELRDLMATIDRELAERLSSADQLTPYGVEFRYPGDVSPVDREDARNRIVSAELIKEELLRALKDYLDAGRTA